MKTARIIIQLRGDEPETLLSPAPTVTADLPIEDLLHGAIFPGIRACDDGEWTWEMQENQPERLKAVEDLLHDAYRLLLEQPAPESEEES
jgi:hypothetical protein